jgi:hypothetical protein
MGAAYSPNTYEKVFRVTTTMVPLDSQRWTDLVFIVYC